jgi:hypothetical protein
VLPEINGFAKMLEFRESLLDCRVRRRSICAQRTSSSLWRGVKRLRVGQSGHEAYPRRPGARDGFVVRKLRMIWLSRQLGPSTRVMRPRRRARIADGDPHLESQRCGGVPISGLAITRLVAPCGTKFVAVSGHAQRN